MDHDASMQAALREAKKSLKAKAAPIGAVVVKDGIIIASAHNQKDKLSDPTAHAEILAIRKAAKQCGPNLDGCILYSTLKPCLMCISASYWAHIETIYYGTDYEVGNKYFVTHDDSRDDILQDMVLRRVKLFGGLLKHECKSLFR
jgi:tRNA(Arg) A34 adenosine deaminase TadA